MHLLKDHAKPLQNVDAALVKALKERPVDYWDFREADTQEMVHGLHTYPAVMVSPISRSLLGLMGGLQEFNSLLDPFMGSGTVLVEAMLSGVPCIFGNDLNPLARLITKVKTTPISPHSLDLACAQLVQDLDIQYHRRTAFLEEVEGYVRKQRALNIGDRASWGRKAPDILHEYMDAWGVHFKVPHFKNLGYWFLPRVILELQTIKDALEDARDPDVRDFLRIAFSETVRLVSNRRNGEFKMFRMAPEKLAVYAPDTRKTFLRLIQRNTEKMKVFWTALQGAAKDTERILTANDARDLSNIPEEAIDLMITSPPYGDSRTTVAYGEFSRVSLQWLDLSEITPEAAASLDKQLMGGTGLTVGAEGALDSPYLLYALENIREKDSKRAEEVYRFYRDLNLSLKSITRKMRKNSYQFWVVGNRTVKLETLQTDKVLADFAKQHGLVHVHTIERNIPNKVMPSLNSPSNVQGEKAATMTREHIVVLRKA